jgi:malate dehydrogenase (quinone)
LKKFYVNAEAKDWELEIAGQRVQVIKKDPKKGGILQFGTEVVTSADGSISALLGASPGASTSVPIMLELIQRCFPKEFQSEAWQNKLTQMVPSFGQSLEKHPDLCQKMRSWTSEALELNRPISA